MFFLKGFVSSIESDEMCEEFVITTFLDWRKCEIDRSKR